jgi:hypothetical protein
METIEEKKGRRTKTILFITAGIAAICVALYLIHELFMPLDILWIKVERKIMKMGF